MPDSEDHKLAPAKSVAIVTPMLNEAEELHRLRDGLNRLSPAPAEIILVDGGSEDSSVGIAKNLGFQVIEIATKGRAVQINAGVNAAASDFICVVHADSQPPEDAVAVIRKTLDDSKVSLGAFTPLITGPDQTRWVSSFHNWIKTWYAPLFFRPLFFLRGGRLFFGDHGMFFRRADFLKIGGCDPTLLVMEDAEICLKFGPLGRQRLIPRFTRTSDRRIAKWGGLKANLIYFKVGFMWAIGLRHASAKHYPDVRSKTREAD